MRAVALRICCAVSSTRVARSSSDTATASNAALTSESAASWSSTAASLAGGRTGGATCTTGPYAVPGLTPMPWRVSAPAPEPTCGPSAEPTAEPTADSGRDGVPDSVVATSLLRVEVAREQCDERVESLVGALTLGRQHDLLAVPGSERHDPEDARRVDGVLTGLGDLDVEAGVARGFDEEGRR